MAVLMHSCELYQNIQRQRVKRLIPYLQGCHYHMVARLNKYECHFTYTCNRWPISCMRKADIWRYDNSRSGEMPFRLLGELAKSSDVKYHMESLSRSPLLLRIGDGLGIPLMMYHNQTIGNQNIERSLNYKSEMTGAWAGGCCWWRVGDKGDL